MKGKQGTISIGMTEFSYAYTKNRESRQASHRPFSADSVVRHMQKIVGGEPFDALELKYGTSADSILLTIKETLADYAKKGIKQIEELL